MIKTVKRGEVYLANMDTDVQGVLIVQNNRGNLFSPTTIVLEIKDTKIDYFSLRTIDKSRLIKRVGQLSTYQMQQVSENMTAVILGVREPALV
ncbi:type II toxin-antitoxin system PemK/MazF family toxin [Evansella cellulosilytica]|uniref:PemK family transcriptional regulator n=1 Tax=Evansella cellulosilytica (strain ATCC 21833 / DSM 2522 / FERM P-1141 / JCM 9156 / N-4) TaxID=649639 RepID=E6TZT7_EVAC2|nr:type II toxin-antitoxin system PemK/MazF family toxin [Evansella cellulosilytica]ADU32503.1 PemK family transcriptional regulator [Evansella cellulosilytica DSM 2522]